MSEFLGALLAILAWRLVSELQVSNIVDDIMEEFKEYEEEKQVYQKSRIGYGA